MHLLTILLMLLTSTLCESLPVTDKTAIAGTKDIVATKTDVSLLAKETVISNKDMQLPNKGAIPSDQIVSFDVITTFEGNIDPKNPPKIKTYIKANQKLYTIINPDFSNANGAVKYVSVLNQHMNKDGTVTYEGSAKSQLDGSGQLGTNVQTFDLEKMTSKEEIYKKFSVFLYNYLKYILATGNSVDQELLKDLFNNYVYFGALSKGQNPQNEIYFKNSFNNTEKDGEVTYEAKASAKTDDNIGGSLTYGVANINDKNKENSLQQTFNVNFGKSPKNYIEMSAVDSKLYNVIQTGSKSQVDDLDKKDQPTFASVYSDGSTKTTGMSDQQAQSSLQVGNKTVAYSQGFTSSIDKRKYLLDITNAKCVVKDFNGYKFTSVELNGLDKYKKNISECELLKSVYNSL